VCERLEKDAGISPTQWLATVRPDGRPHVMPVWAIWVDDAFYFVTGTTTRKISHENSYQKNLMRKMRENDASSKIISFPQTGTAEWIESYVKEALTTHDGATVEVYQQILRHFTIWVAELPGHEKRFLPTQLIPTSIDLYLSTPRDQGYSVSHRNRVKSVLSGSACGSWRRKRPSAAIPRVISRCQPSRF
jgi:hypothetical protein